MRTYPYTLNGKTWHLCLNGAALFDIYEKYGDKGFVTDYISGSGKEAFQATYWMLSKLAEQGELVRRYQGFDHGSFPTEQMFRATLSPLDVADAKLAIKEAVRLGFLREEAEEDQAVDLGLLELEKKTGPG